jgi:hypothetical protein
MPCPLLRSEIEIWETRRILILGPELVFHDLSVYFALEAFDRDFPSARQASIMDTG